MCDAEEKTYEAAYAFALACITRRERCSYELQQRLLDKGFKESETDAVINRLIRNGLLDDARFAELYTRSKLTAGWGVYRIVHELEKRKIAVEDYPQEATEYDYDSEMKRAIELLAQKGVHSKNPAQTLYRRLISKGFPPSLSSRAVREYLREQEAVLENRS